MNTHCIIGYQMVEDTRCRRTDGGARRLDIQRFSAWISKRILV